MDKDLPLKEKNYINFYINSEKKLLIHIDPKTTVLQYLRSEGYTGTKYGCGEGGCGACTIVIAEYDSKIKLINYRSANSCLLPICSMNNKQIITIEGIGNVEKPHPIQKRFAEGHASQCGFCTPGIVMAFYGFLKLNPNSSKHDIEESFDGNLCRCTGYRPILDMAKTFSHEHKNELNDYKEFDDTIKIPFPTEFINKEENLNPVILKNENSVWIEPANLQQLLRFKNEHPDYKLIGGNTEIGIDIHLKSVDFKKFINLSNLNELKNLDIVLNEKNEQILEIGANITLSKLIDCLKLAKSNNIHKNFFDSFLSNLKWFASTQIRNFATLAGNIITGSPISDLSPVFMSHNAILILLSEKSGLREVPIRNFYTDYRRNVLKSDEILFKINLEIPSSNLVYVKSYKQAKRKDDDIAIVNSCFRVKLNEDNSIIELDISYGGLAPTTIYLSKLNKKFKGLKWDHNSTLELIQDSILEEIKLSYSVPGGMATYRRTLSVSFFTRFWYQSIKDLNINTKKNLDLKNIDEIHRGISFGRQDINGITNQETEYLIGTTNPHVSALKQTTGIAQYVDDIPKQNGELYSWLVLSTKPHAIIKNIDTSKALSINGVHDFITYKDIHHNLHGVVFKDEEFLASKKVYYVGQPIGVIVADTKDIAKKASLLVNIEYEELESILTIEDAIEKNSLINYNQKIDNYEKTEIFDDVNDIIMQGKCEIGGQEHFYLETYGCLSIPGKEDDEILVYTTTQNINETQKEIALALNIPYNRVIVKVKRLGGGFGGKETKCDLAVLTSVAAKKANRPVRCILDRDTDMLITGTRHSFIGYYKLRISKDGYFKAYDLDMISNAGFSLDLSGSVMDRAILSCDNVYNFNNIRVKGRLAKTNLSSNTAFRGFGGPQSMMITEMMIAEVAEKLNLDQVEIRQKNMYKELDKTHYNTILYDWYLPEMWYKLKENSNYQQLKKEVDDFNLNNKFKKRGLALIPSKYGLSFTARFLNQAGALVHIYTDGSVLLSHGGIEMGQGLHTKMIQIAANCLNIPIDKVFISETSTDKVANTSPTAASVSSDLNGMAVKNACDQLNERLLPYKQNNPNGSFKDWVTSAYYDRVNLSANGFYKTPDLTYDWQKNEGKIFNYFTTGVGLSMVELDLFTGDHIILRTDILMDIGQSINYSIDIGQIEGALIQGIGWCTIEELLVLRQNGSRFTRGPGNYKIPSFRDIPLELNIKILRDKKYIHLNTIKSSKGVGEPPLFLGSTVYFALRNAVLAARKQNNVNEPLNYFPSPCTAEILRISCSDLLSQKSHVKPNDFEKKWCIRP